MSEIVKIPLQYANQYKIIRIMVAYVRDDMRCVCSLVRILSQDASTKF